MIKINFFPFNFAAYRNNYEKETENVLEIAIQSFKQPVRKLKSTRKIH
jgi:hypothetical protein